MKKNIPVRCTFDIQNMHVSTNIMVLRTFDLQNKNYSINIIALDLMSLKLHSRAAEYL
jgi:hypothetical protein